MKRIREVLRMGLELKLTQREIALITGVSRDTVSTYLTRAEATRLIWPLPDDLDDRALEDRLFPTLSAEDQRRAPQPDWDEILIEMKKKGATLQLLHTEYLREHPDGMAYSLFCQRHREHRQLQRRWMRNEHKAGERAFVDFAGKTMPIHDLKTGKKHMAQIFVGVLGASNYVYAEAVWSQKLPDWIMANVRMLEFFGGATAVIVCDNLKSAVVKADRHLPEVHPAYEAMARHYGTKIIPARPYEPQDKAKAEQSVQIVTRWILFALRKRIFTDLAELNRAIAELLAELNLRKMQKLKVSRRELFEVSDRDALRQLPASRYVYADWYKVRAGMDCHIEIDEQRYSVPFTLANNEVEVQLGADTVEVFYRGRRVASHVRAHQGQGAITDPKHLDPNIRYYATWAPERELEWALGVGQPVHDFLQRVFGNAKHKEDGYRPAQALKGLHRLYETERLTKACAFALTTTASKVQFVRQLLRNGLEGLPAPTDAPSPTDAPPGAAAEPETNGNAEQQGHPNVRGGTYYR